MMKANLIICILKLSFNISEVFLIFNLLIFTSINRIDYLEI